MKKVILMPVLFLIAFTVIGCARAIQKEYAIVDGKSVITAEIEYDRIGDQKLSGLHLIKEEPNGVRIDVGLDEQISEGKLQIEGVIAALAEVIASLQSQGIMTEAAQLETITETLAATQ